MINTLVAALAIPLFLLIMWVEYKVSKSKKLEYFNFNSTISNICIGIAERLSDLFLAGVFYSIFNYIQKNFGVFEIDNTISMYLLLLIVTDFIWYWYHRSGHEVNIFWASHIVHHQSEDFNFTVSARITMFQSLIRLLFWSVLPLIGFSAPMVSLILLAHGLYPFFLHTRTIKKLGILEKLLVTPSHHRVHHASNEEYLDKNYGSIFIIWDKLFGTFKEEKTEPVYGLTSQLKSHSFLWQHFHCYLELWEALKLEKSLLKKLKVLFSKPETIPSEIRDRLENKYLTKKYHQTPTLRLTIKKYLIVQMITVLALLTAVALFEHYLAIHYKIIVSSFIIITVINCCAVLEQRTWIFYLEFARVMLLMLTIGIIFSSVITFIIITVYFVSMVYFFEDLKKLFLTLMYGAFFYNRLIIENSISQY